MHIALHREGVCNLWDLRQGLRLLTKRLARSEVLLRHGKSYARHMDAMQTKDLLQAMHTMELSRFIICVARK